jgi:anthranilate 1,2-dioxygenase small subunit
VSALRAELRDLYDDYASCLDEMDLDAWCGFFTDDCLYKVISFENYSQDLPLALIECRGIGMVRDRVAAIRETAVYEPRQLRHFVSGVRVDRVEGEVVAARANFLIAESLSDREPQIAMVGRYLDRLVRVGTALRFKERLCVVDNYRIRTSLVVPV